VSKTEVLIGTLERAIARTAKLMDVDPALAAEQAEEILTAVPNHPPSLFHLAMAKRRMGDPEGALQILEPLLNAQHKWGAAFFEQGLAFADLGRGDQAIDSLYKAVENQPDHPEAWRVLGDHLVATGEPEKADAAYARHVQCSTQDPTLQEAAAAMVRNNVSVAERKLKKYLMQKPTDVAAIRMLAEVAAR
jgi:tetratricopeptide (TPR) repeat protein